MAGTLPLKLWDILSGLAPGLLRRFAARAHLRMQAPPGRLAERYGQAGLPRPRGRLIWLHAASVGEVGSVARLARLLLAEPGVSLLVSTTTASGAAAVARQLPGALHQFAPVDTSEAVTGFLDHWQPQAALFVEGDLWPRMMAGLRQRGIATALLNARPSKTRSRAPKSYAALLEGLQLITLQEESLRAEFLALGVPAQVLQAPGNLKADLTPPAADPALVQHWQRAAAGRHIWAATSTHEGEEEIVLDAFAALKTPTLLLLAPRHPERGDGVAAMLRRRGIPFTRQSLGEMPAAQTQVHLIDALGLLGSVYQLAEIALVGGSLLPGPGGHTPYEPAAAGCAILTGPHLRNFAAAYTALARVGAMQGVMDAPTLARTLSRLLADTPGLQHMRQAARAEQSRHEGAAQRSLSLLAPLLQLPAGHPAQPDEPL